MKHLLLSDIRALRQSSPILRANEVLSKVNDDPTYKNLLWTSCHCADDYLQKTRKPPIKCGRVATRYCQTHPGDPFYPICGFHGKWKRSEFLNFKTDERVHYVLCKPCEVQLWQKQSEPVPFEEICECGKELRKLCTLRACDHCKWYQYFKMSVIGRGAMCEECVPNQQEFEEAALSPDGGDFADDIQDSLKGPSGWFVFWRKWFSPKGRDADDFRPPCRKKHRKRPSIRRDSTFTCYMCEKECGVRREFYLRSLFKRREHRQQTRTAFRWCLICRKLEQDPRVFCKWSTHRRRANLRSEPPRYLELLAMEKNCFCEFCEFGVSVSRKGQIDEHVQDRREPEYLDESDSDCGGVEDADAGFERFYLEDFPHDLGLECYYTSDSESENREREYRRQRTQWFAQQGRTDNTDARCLPELGKNFHDAFFSSTPGANKSQ